MNSIAQTIKWFRSQFQQASGKSSFYKNEVIMLNKLLSGAAHSISFGQYSSPASIELEKRIIELELPVLELSVDKNGIPNISGYNKQLLVPFQGRLNKLKSKKITAVRDKDFRAASSIRDKEKQLTEEILVAIQKDNSFIEGFNYYDNSILIVVPKAVLKSYAIKSLLQDLGILSNHPSNK